MEENKQPEAAREAENTAQAAQTDRKAEARQEFLEWLRFFLIALVIASGLNFFVLANATIPTGSMETTIMPHSRVLGLRLAYTFGEVHRDDVAIFIYGYTCLSCKTEYRETDEGVCPNCGRSNKWNKKIYYVKRVIGMPGDHVQILPSGYATPDQFAVNPRLVQNLPADTQLPVGTVYINGEAKEEIYLSEPMIADGQLFPLIDLTVPEGSYYMLGDNRNNSSDARFWGENNFISRDRMIAKCGFQYWPFTQIGVVK